MEKALPSIPAKRYFTIGEVSDLCGVKPYVLRYWEQEFTQLKPMKRRGNRRYYQHHEVLLIRRIRDLLYEQGFTISGARNRLTESGGAREPAPAVANGEPVDDAIDLDEVIDELEAGGAMAADAAAAIPQPEVSTMALSIPQMRQELISIRGLLAI
jgi:DNA-binding transcriptional MerR regulator